MYLGKLFATATPGDRYKFYIFREIIKSSNYLQFSLIKDSVYLTSYDELSALTKALKSAYVTVLVLQETLTIEVPGLYTWISWKNLWMEISPPILDRFLSELGQVEGKIIVFTITKDYRSIILTYIVTLDLRIPKADDRNSNRRHCVMTLCQCKSVCVGFCLFTNVK